MKRPDPIEASGEVSRCYMHAEAAWDYLRAAWQEGRHIEAAEFAAQLDVWTVRLYAALKVLVRVES